MATQIVAVNSTATNAGGTPHRHISEAKTTSGRVLARSELVSRLESGEEDFCTVAGGENARVIVGLIVVKCPVCSEDDYIRTTADATSAESLLILPPITTMP